MRVILKTTLAGPDGTASPGSEQDYPEKLANDLVKGGFAIPVPETTSIEPPEKAVMPRAKARRKKE